MKQLSFLLYRRTFSLNHFEKVPFSGKSTAFLARLLTLLSCLFLLCFSFFLLLTHSALFTLCLFILSFLYGIVTGKSSFEAQLLKTSLEASTSVSPLRGISICKSSLWGNSIWSPLMRHMRCKASSRRHLLTQTIIYVAESKSLSSRHQPLFFSCLESSWHQLLGLSLDPKSSTEAFVVAESSWNAVFKMTKHLLIFFSSGFCLQKYR